MLSGPNLVLYRRIAEGWPTLRLQASGGVREGADVAAARDAGCAGIVLGRALLESHFELADVLCEARPC